MQSPSPGCNAPRASKYKSCPAVSHRRRHLCLCPTRMQNHVHSSSHRQYGRTSAVAPSLHLRQLAFDGRLGEDVCVIAFIQHIVSNMLDNGRCLLIVDQVGCFDDKLFGLSLNCSKTAFSIPVEFLQPPFWSAQSRRRAFLPNHISRCCLRGCALRYYKFQISLLRKKCLPAMPLGLYLVHGAEFYLEEYLGNSKVAIEGRKSLFPQVLRYRSQQHRQIWG